LAGSPKKTYAVFQGHVPGLYRDWATTAQQVKGFKGAVYKGFASRSEAVSWLRDQVLAATEPVSDSLISLIKSESLDSGLDAGQQGDSRIIIHTDGGASPNPGVGGYGVVLQHGNFRKELSAGYELTTNNRMELLAVIVALEALKEPLKAILHTDSKYVVDSIMKGWAKGWRRKGWKKSNGERPENVDLWTRLLGLLETQNVEFRWVKGHAGNVENERCDLLVNEARQKQPLIVDEGYLRPPS